MRYRFGLSRVALALSKGSRMSRDEAKLIDAFRAALRRAFR